MGLDIKIPIGMMFVIFGILLTIFGLVTNGSEMYEQSLGHNINLWSGIFMIVFGGVMLAFSDLFKKKKLEDKLKQS
jgi:formate hydrogenlyase subunit 3/multisubunit Na+/H+ antiporter MnhD subunit